MPEYVPIVGWDIGGAHVKAAVLDPAGRLLRVELIGCPLWRSLDRLEVAIETVLADLPEAPVSHAVTMTGELADLFPDRLAGVEAIAGCLARVLSERRSADDAHCWAGALGFLPPDALSSAGSAIASANWLATTACCAGHWQDGLLVDIGSTTTDIVPFAAHAPRPSGRTDAERLESGELVYLGIVRTPLMALAERVPVSGRWRRCMNEHFATMADVLRVRGELDETIDLHSAADNGAKTRGGSIRRLLRMVGEDATTADATLADELADWYHARLIDNLATATGEVLAAAELPPQAPLVAAGIGATLVQELGTRFKRPVVNCADALTGTDTAPEIVIRATQCAPAVAVARLARTAMR